MRIMNNAFIKCIKCIVVVIALLLVFAIKNMNVTFASETSSVILSELKSDSSFNINDYPVKTFKEVKESDGRFLDVIQIAETTNDNLVLYVYQPTDPSLEIVATAVSMSTGIGDNLHPYRYTLKLLATDGVFDKYLVEDFKILDGATRYYEIPAIYCQYRELFKDNELNESTNEIGFEVGKRYSAKTINGNVVYECVETEVIEVTKMYPFTQRKLEADDYIFSQLTIYKENVDFHCVAFSTDIDMDHLLEIEMEYKIVKYTETEINLFEFLWWDIWNIEFERTYETDKEDVLETHKVFNDMELIESSTNIFHPSYSWNRILSSNNFIKNNDDLTEESIEFLNDYDWILTFEQTKYGNYDTLPVDVYSGYEVFDVVLLRFKFEKEGQIYNLGVVSDVKTGPQNSINDDTKDDDNKLSDLIERIIEIVKTVLIILLIIVVVYYLYKGIKFTISIIASKKNSKK